MRFPRSTAIALTTVWGSGCWFSCFVGHTRVATPDGPRPIRDLRPGDAVYAWSFERGEAVVRRVLAATSDTVAFVLAVRFGELALPGVTLAHPVWDCASSTWRPAGDLDGAVALAWVPGADARDAAHTRTVRVDGPVVVHNISVEGEENYFAEGVLVHNKSNPDILVDTALDSAAPVEPVGDCDVDTSASFALDGAREVFVGTEDDAGLELPDGLDVQTFTDVASFEAYLSERGITAGAIDFATEAAVAVSYAVSSSCGTGLNGWNAWEGPPHHVEVAITDISAGCPTACDIEGRVTVILAVPADGAPTVCARVTGGCSADQGR
jgi:hypothetical protein